jgi:nucleoside-diphosphate-sugar epimerase
VIAPLSTWSLTYTNICLSGGSLLTYFLDSSVSSIKHAHYSVLLRDASQRSLFTPLGVVPVVLQTPDDLYELRKIASCFDIVINSAYTFLTEHAKALVLGLGDRRKAKPKGPVPRIIHTSGTSNLADRPHSVPARVEKLRIPHEFTDLESSEVYETEKRLEAEEQYAQRTTELAVIDTGVEVGIKTHVIMSPTIYGPGIGPGNKLSMQIPLLIRCVMQKGYLAIVGEGREEWSRIHIQDLLDLYTILLTRILDNKAVPSGKEGILFSETTRTSWRDLAQLVLTTGMKLGKLPTDAQIKNMDLQEAIASWGLPEQAAGIAELGFASNSRTKAERAREWGWQPKCLNMATAVEADWKAVLEKR